MKMIYYKVKKFFQNLNKYFENYFINKRINRVLNNLSKPIDYSIGYSECIKKYGNYSLYFPLEIVWMVIWKIYSKNNSFSSLKIHGIKIDTQQDEVIKIEIILRRPGYIIGKGGILIDELKNKLKEIFGKDIYVHLNEIKKDKNEVIEYYRL